MEMQLEMLAALAELEPVLVLEGYIGEPVNLPKMLTVGGGKAWMDDTENKLDARTTKRIMDVLEPIAAKYRTG